ncbi:DNA repair protein RecO [Desertivirga brevis]|uniref:DNA repair protein RecO n=1 Tax=Desertivirga brevis TaxID=2810310 RepID=UPI001A9621CD|nr:DNA repair protein RecO [Pedobacter sp. SYSU D00873]
MLHKTRGIVFKVTDYSESSVIVQIFTEKFGLQSYLINGAKKPRAKIRLNMIQPLHLLDLVVYHKPNGNIQRISELRNAPLFQSIPYNLIKSSLTIFLNEVLYKSIKVHFDDAALFEFLFNSIELLDRAEKGLSNFHLLFLMNLSRYLGFYPDKKGRNSARYFDLVNGLFTDVLPEHALILHDQQLAVFGQLLDHKYSDLHELKISAEDRKDLLKNILRYFELHLENFSHIQSHIVLEEVLG